MGRVITNGRVCSFRSFTMVDTAICAPMETMTMMSRMRPKRNATLFPVATMPRLASVAGESGDNQPSVAGTSLSK